MELQITDRSREHTNTFPDKKKLLDSNGESMSSLGSTTNGSHPFRLKIGFSLYELFHLEKIKIMQVPHINFQLHFPMLSFFSFLFPLA